MSWTKADLPLAPVSGNWKIRRIKDDLAKSAESNITRTVVSIDPAFHATPPSIGTVLLDTNTEIDQGVTINTRSLSNGYHMLLIRADSFVPAGSVFDQEPFTADNPAAGGTNSAVLAIAFEVKNP